MSRAQDWMKRLVQMAVMLLVVGECDIWAQHHMGQRPPHWVSKRNSEVPLRVTNRCNEEIYPAIQTQSGVGPPSSGFRLGPGASQAQTVSADWQGRVWGRTNCSFNAQGTAPANGAAGPACLTGDCGGTVACHGSGQPPASLAEFTLETGSGQSFYDISLVDGYNVPMGLILLDRGRGHDDAGSGDKGTNKVEHIPPNLTNPICIGTWSLLESLATAMSDERPEGGNSTYPLPLEQSVDESEVSSWCPWDLQLARPQKPDDGVYPYPDHVMARPTFQACFSACAKFSKPADCCTGKHSTPATCKPSLYSRQAKRICPDAYSYAYDDQSSTFIIPSGGGFELIFCPRGRSTTILSTLREEVIELAQGRGVTQRILDKAKSVGLNKANVAA